MTHRSVVTLYRPVGPEELTLLAASDWTAFPPRLPEQPFFYPVLQEAYARKIASNWNVASSGCGFVTRFIVDELFLTRYEPHAVGGNEHSEYWVPAEELSLFNRNIVSIVKLISEHFSSAWCCVYRLVDDVESIASAQAMTLRGASFGLAPDFGLLGSDEWWSAIGDGRIGRKYVFGTICEHLVTGHRDWSEFRIRSWDGSHTTWTMYGDAASYAIGRRVLVEYVPQRPKAGVFESVGQVPVVLRIMTESTSV
jgi:hypothetical protein